MIRSLDELLNFLAAFHPCLAATPPIEAACIPADLPDALAELYRRFGGVMTTPVTSGGLRPFDAQDRIRPIDRLKRGPGGVEFAEENSGNWVARCALGPGDPIVYSNFDPSEWVDYGPVDGWWPCGSLSHFLITLALQEAVMSAPYLVTAYAASARESTALPLEPLWLDGRLVMGPATDTFYYSKEREIIAADLGFTGAWWASYREIAPDVLKDGVEMTTISPVRQRR
jgi:hypothetical protein